jgi:response regulator RpfG family c-di-GMP phosphodiesterase
MLLGCAEKINLLFVDDDEQILRLFERTLRDTDFGITATGDVSTALEQAERGAYEIIICDYMMPKMDGITFLERCRAKVPDSLRIIITGEGDYRVAIDAVNRGGIFKLIAKPWDSQALHATLKEAADQYRTKREADKLSRLFKEQNTELHIRTLNLDREIHERTGSFLHGLVTALDLRDTETRWHSRRVSLYASRIAGALGIRGDEVGGIERGALLHDLGKIGIRDNILLKAGRLTVEEWGEMRRHPEMGYKLLDGSEFLARERIIVLHHQERYDGKGYPQGLSGKEIDIGARIFAVADTFDAMTSDRPYRQALSFKYARDEIIRCSGSQFDPHIVDAFLSVPSNEWVEIKDKLESRDAHDENLFLAAHQA